MTALFGQATSFIAGYECNFPVLPSGFVGPPGYRLTQTAQMATPTTTVPGVVESRWVDDKTTDTRQVRTYLAG